MVAASLQATVESHIRFPSSTTVSVTVAIVSALIALVALVIAALQYRQLVHPWRLIYTWRELRPRYKQRMLRALRNRTAPSEAEQGFYALARRKPDAQIIEITLTGAGRRDIRSELFELKEPLTVDVGTPIFAALSRSRPKWVRAPSAELDGQYLKIGPGLIAKRQYLSYHLLVSCGNCSVALHAALADVAISTHSPESELLQRIYRASLRSFPSALIMLVCYVVLASWMATNSFQFGLQNWLLAIDCAFILALINGYARTRNEDITDALLVPEGSVIMLDEQSRGWSTKS